MKSIEAKKSHVVGIWIFTLIVFALVSVLHELGGDSKLDLPITKNFPLMNAIINGTCFFVLILSLLMIKKGNVILHMRLNTLAMILSVFFLLSYVLYHSSNPSRAYGGPDSLKSIYYFILATHIILAGISLPMILFTYYRGLVGNKERHRKLAKITYPIWLYVTLTGVLVYVFLYLL